MPITDPEVLAALREGLKRQRNYAGYFNWNADRDLEELGVVQELRDSLEAARVGFFKEPRSRGRGDDPPDVEAIDEIGQRVAIEVTELVDGGAIQRDKKAHSKNASWQDKLSIPTAWDAQLLHEHIQERISSKDDRFPSLKGTPYPGGYIVVLYTDEPDLTPEKVHFLLAEQTFKASRISRCFLLIGYQPFQDHLSFFELSLVRPSLFRRLLSLCAVV